MNHMQIQVFVLGQTLGQVVRDGLNASIDSVRVRRIIGQQRDPHGQ
jgi:hypothetical protein